MLFFYIPVLAICRVEGWLGLGKGELGPVDYLTVAAVLAAIGVGIYYFFKILGERVLSGDKAEWGYLGILIVLLGVVAWNLVDYSNPNHFKVGAHAVATADIVADDGRTTIPAGTEVGILGSSDKSNALVELENGDRLFVERNLLKVDSTKSLKGVFKSLDKEYMYYITADKLASYVGQPVEKFVEEVGEPVTRKGGAYSYPYLTELNEAGRSRGVDVVVDGDGTVASVAPSADAQISRDIFQKLPGYRALVTSRLYRVPANPFSNFYFVAILFFPVLLIFFCRGLNLPFHHRYDPEVDPTVFTVLRVISWTVVAVTGYVFLVMALDVTYTWWGFSLFILFFMVIFPSILAMGTNETAAARCPHCRATKAYAPVKRFSKREPIGRATIDGLSNIYNMSDVREWRPLKHIMERNYYKMVGECSNCGYVDHDLYSEEREFSSREKCPFCLTNMVVDEHEVTFTKNRTSKERDKMKMDLRDAEHLGSTLGGEEVFRGPADVTRDVRVDTYYTITYKEHCTSCGFGYGPHTFRGSLSHTHSETSRENRKGKLSNW